MPLPSRRPFLQTLGAASVATLAGHPRPVCAAAATPAAEAVPSYLRGYEARFRENPRAAAVQWHHEAKWGLFLHYALESLRGLTAAQALQAKGAGNEWKKLKAGADVDYRALRDRFTAERFDADQTLALLADAFAQEANLTLNTGPLPDGSIHPADVAALREAGARIRRKGFPAPARMDRTARKKIKKLK